MKILYLSDIHLGNPLFKSEDVLMELLHKDYDHIFLIGDIIDTWEGDVGVIVNKHKTLIDTINKLNNIHIILGNHDPSESELRKIFINTIVIEHWIGAFDFDLFTIIHGHQFDHIIMKHEWMARLLFPIQWFFQRFGINPRGYLRDLYHSISVKRQEKYYNDLVIDVEKNAAEKYKNCKYIIMGHTHMPKIVKTEDTTYINCGDWIHNNTYVEYENGEFRLKYI